MTLNNCAMYTQSYGKNVFIHNNIINNILSFQHFVGTCLICDVSCVVQVFKSIKVLIELSGLLFLVKGFTEDEDSEYK